MTLDEAECWRRLARSRHGILATLHPRRGVDAVPVVFALTDHRILVPVDTEKPKRHSRLTRLANLRADPRCVLLVEHYRSDWSRLWWVRIHADGLECPAAEEFVEVLARRYPQYRTAGVVAGVLVLTPTELTGWAP